MNNTLTKSIFIILAVFLSSCGSDSSRGYEFMPNMYRSPSIETYEEHSIKNFDRIPVNGTVSRGNLVTFNYENNANKITLTTIGSSVLANEATTIITNYKKQRRAVSGSQHIPVESPIKKELTEKEHLAIADQVSQLIGRIDEDMLREFVKDLAEKTEANELTLEYVIKRGNELLGKQ